MSIMNDMIRIFIRYVFEIKIIDDNTFAKMFEIDESGEETEYADKMSGFAAVLTLFNIFLYNHKSRNDFDTIYNDFDYLMAGAGNKPTIKYPNWMVSTNVNEISYIPKLNSEF